MNKMSLIIFPKTICRTPVFSLDCIFEYKWEFLKRLIKDSSPEFYYLIKDFRASEIPEQPFKIRYTVWKYWNRAKYRATPFGQFAASTLMPIKSSSQCVSFQVSKEMYHSKFVSWKNKDHLGLTAKPIYENAAFFRTNSSFYVVGNEIRYLYNDGGMFQLTSVQLHSSLLQVLRNCVNTRTREDLNQILFELLQLSGNENDELVEQLIDMQLLLTDCHPNIIGSDYFQRFGLPVTENLSSYTISRRKLIAGEVPSSKFDNLKELIPLLARVLPINTNPCLEKFKKQYLNRYEHRLEVPLLEALDPEIGIGYMDIANSPLENLLVDEVLQHDTQHNPYLQIPYSHLHKFILNNISTEKPIQLEELEVGDMQRKPLPNTFSALVQLTGENIIAKQIGGCSATALLGRFTLADGGIESFANEIAQIEEEANPEVLFFDIAYQAESHIDDINRRKKLYSFELPILTWSEGNEILELNDLMVSVIGDMIILRSKKYNKRVIPRLASAYNYSRSDLSVFRFLADLQHQGLQTDLTFNLEGFFPELNHYPRVMYKDVVLSPEKWLFPERFYKKDALLATEKVQELKSWLNEKKIKTPFLCGSSDQKLCFDPLKNEDLTFLLLFCRNMKKLYIEEAFLPQNSLIHDEMKNPYLAEFILSFSHIAAIYTPLFSQPIDNSKVKEKNEKQFIPGSEWLYLKFYCHPSRSNELLLTTIKNVLIRNRIKIKKWFFIRYHDPEYHIRLRIHLKSPKDLHSVLESFQVGVGEHIRNGTIQDLQLAIYNREINRYRLFIDNVETIFGLDSKFILRLLQEDFSIHNLYSVSINLLMETMEKLDMPLNDQVSFVKKMAESFSSEHKLTSAVFKKINKSFREFYAVRTNFPLKRSLTTNLSKLSDEYAKQLRKSCIKDREKLLADVFHMHVNRLYAVKQRAHELVIYEYTWKILKKYGKDM